MKRGSLTVVKNAVGGDGVFTFTSQTLGGFVLTTTNGTAQQAFTNVVSGTYAVSETVPAGWRLDTAVCSDGSSVDSIGVSAGEDVTCTLTNLKLDTIVVVKRAIGGDGVFTYTSPALGNFSLTTVNGEAQRSFSNLPQGTYSITETAPVGWTPTVAEPTCSNGDKASNINLGPGPDSGLCLRQPQAGHHRGGEADNRRRRHFPLHQHDTGRRSFNLTTSGGVTTTAFSGLDADDLPHQRDRAIGLGLDRRTSPTMATRLTASAWRLGLTVHLRLYQHGTRQPDRGQKRGEAATRHLRYRRYLGAVQR